MKIIPVRVDGSQKEYMPYKDSAFPLDIWVDVYDRFIDETLNCHWHPAFEFSVLISGALDFYINGVHMRMSEGDCIFINSNTMHSAKQVQGSRGSVIKGVGFPASLLAGSTDSTVYKKYFEPVIVTTMQGFVISRDVDFAREMGTLILEINGLKDTDFGYELNCLSLLNRLWKETFLYISNNEPALLVRRTNRRYEERTKKIMSYIHGNYMENITVESLARHANISRSECFRCFKHFTNKSPIEYITEYRLAIAAKILAESNISVTEIGTACGFSSSSYFGKLFKEVYGVTPGRYRTEHNL